MRRIIYAALFFGVAASLSAWAKAESDGKISIFRWNQGFRAEREPVFEGALKEADFRSMVKEGRLPESPEIYKGCYLAYFELEKSHREPAAEEAKPKSEIFRICR